MKICLVSTHILKTPPEAYGGLEAMVSDLAMELDALGHHVTLIGSVGSTPPPHGAFFSAGEAMKVDDVTAFKALLAHEQAGRFIRDADVIHDHTWFYAPYLLKNEKPDWPILHTHHGMDPGFKDKPPWPMSGVGISANHAHRMTQMSGVPFRFVYNGVKVDRYPFQEEKGKRLLFVSRLAPFKGALDAIRIAEKAKVPIDIVGGSFGDPGEYVQAVKDACSKSEYAKFHGEVDHKTKVSMMQNAKALLVPVQVAGAGGAAWAEPFGLFVPEGNLCGTPVITAANGGLKELVQNGKTGFLCNHDADYLTAIERLDEIQPKHCRQWAVENFSAHRMALEYLRLYKMTAAKQFW